MATVLVGTIGCAREKIVYVEVTPVPEATEFAEPEVSTESGVVPEEAPAEQVPTVVENRGRNLAPATPTPIPPTATSTPTFTVTNTPTNTPTPTPIPVTVAQGTVLDVEFLQTLSSHESQVGQEFSVRVVEPVKIDGRIAVPAGTIISGTVTEAKPAKKVGGRSRLSLDFDLLELPTGHQYPVELIFSQKGKSSTGRDAAIIGGATVGGAVLGHQVDDDKGKEVGAIVGAIAGVIAASETRAKPVVLESGTVWSLETTQPLQIEIIQ
jgi:outer membrane lipoprotein SlyB